MLSYTYLVVNVLKIAMNRKLLLFMLIRNILHVYILHESAFLKPANTVIIVIFSFSQFLSFKHILVLHTSFDCYESIIVHLYVFMILRLFKFKILCKLDSFKEIINFCIFKKVFKHIFLL